VNRLKVTTSRQPVSLLNPNQQQWQHTVIPHLSPQNSTNALLLRLRDLSLLSRKDAILYRRQILKRSSLLLRRRRNRLPGLLKQELLLTKVRRTISIAVNNQNSFLMLLHKNLVVMRNKKNPYTLIASLKPRLANTRTRSVLAGKKSCGPTPRFKSLKTTPITRDHKRVMLITETSIITKFSRPVMIRSKSSTTTNTMKSTILLTSRSYSTNRIPRDPSGSRTMKRLLQGLSRPPLLTPHPSKRFKRLSQLMKNPYLCQNRLTSQCKQFTSQRNLKRYLSQSSNPLSSSSYLSLLSKR